MVPQVFYGQAMDAGYGGSAEINHQAIGLLVIQGLLKVLSGVHAT
jgi:hypothetical protein